MCKKLMFLISFVSVLVLASSALAADYTWDGNSPYSSLWVDPLNWEPLGGPGPSDTAKLEPGLFSGVEPVILIDNTVDKIQGPRRDENGDMTLEIVSGWLQLNRWEMVDGSDSGTSIINIGLGIGYGDPCVHINDGFRAFTDEDAGGEVYLNIGGNSYVYVNEDFEVFTDDKDMPGYFEINIGDTATVEVSGMRFGDDTTLSESQLTVSGSATLNVFDGQLRHSDSDTMRILITDDAYVYVDNTFRGADGDAGSDETHITGNAHLVANDGWESQDGTTLWTVDGNALVEVNGGDMYWRNGSLNVGGTATLLVEKDLQHNEAITVFNMYDCGPHVVCEGLGLPSDNDSDFATFNLHGGLIEIGVNGLYHDDDDWLLDICGCGVMVIAGDHVAEILSDFDAGNITACGFGPCGGPADLMVDHNHPDFPGDRTKVWVEMTNRAYDPYPPCDAEDVPCDICLSWTAGATVEEHFVFLHTDINKLTTPGDMSALVAILDAEETTYCPEIPTTLSVTYYWRVDEVWDCGTTTGQVWSFTKAHCMMVDDFESYTDDDVDPDQVFYTWLDGAGDAGGQGGNGTGSSVYLVHDPVHHGENAMEYQYDSSGSERELGYSEAERAFDPTLNLTDQGEKLLAIWFYGDPTNIVDQETDPLDTMWFEVGANGSVERTSYGIYGSDGPADLQSAGWQVWVMSLATEFSSLDLSQVDSMAIGFGEYGRAKEQGIAQSGTVYFDCLQYCEDMCVDAWEGRTRYAPDGDLNHDCIVDEKDLEMQVDDWLGDKR